MGSYLVADHLLHWKPAARIHHVVFPNGAKVLFVPVNVDFDFKPIGDGKKGGAVVERIKRRVTTGSTRCSITPPTGSICT
jgi:hypothetical protein